MRTTYRPGALSEGSRRAYNFRCEHFVDSLALVRHMLVPFPMLVCGKNTWPLEEGQLQCALEAGSVVTVCHLTDFAQHTKRKLRKHTPFLTMALSARTTIRSGILLASRRVHLFDHHGRIAYFRCILRHSPYLI